MIVPRTRLLLWVSLIVLPFAAAAATVPASAPVAILFIGGLLVLAILDAFLGRGRVGGIRVHLPESTRLTKDRAGHLDIRIENASLEARSVRLGLAFPREISTESDDRTAELPAGAAFSRLEWPMTPTKRGHYFLERAYLEIVSPMGFWGVRTSHAARAEMKVYPNLMRERKHVAALFLKRGYIGAHAQRQVGQGREFEKLRDYIPGDSYDEIHWKASAKRGHPVTKMFQVERTQEVYVILDASRLSAREVKLADPDSPSGVAVTTILERYITAALILALAAEQQGDQFGLLTFSDRVLHFVRAKSGQSHYDACRDRLHTLQAQDVTPDFEELCAFIRVRLRRRALLIFLTSLDDPMLAESFGKSTELISRQHLILADMVQPPGAHPLFHDQAVDRTDDLFRQLGGHFQWHSLRELEKALKRRGIRLALLDPEKLAAQLVAQHADVKRRQLI
jgi:uncharacterized protein (DUF58 family)